MLDIIIADLGVELNQLDLPWQGILPGVLAGKFDFVATSVTIKPDRAKQFAFTVPIGEGTTWIMKRKGDTSIMSVDDMAGKVVGTQLASGNEDASKAFEADMKARNHPGLGPGEEELRGGGVGGDDAGVRDGDRGGGGTREDS